MELSEIGQGTQTNSMTSLHCDYEGQQLFTQPDQTWKDGEV
jgi:hypothetical protein